MAKKKEEQEYTEELKPELLEIAEIKGTDETHVEEESPVVQKVKKKKEKSPGFYQYTIKIKEDEPAVILYSKHLVKELSNKLFIKDAFVEGKVEETFLGFPITVSYKESIGNFEFDFNNENWMVVFEYVFIISKWPNSSRKDAMSFIEIKKKELIDSLDALQRAGKIQIKKK